jgi:hypothetical protein
VFSLLVSDSFVVEDVKANGSVVDFYVKCTRQEYYEAEATDAVAFLKIVTNNHIDTVNVHYSHVLLEVKSGMQVESPIPNVLEEKKVYKLQTFSRY